jgi:hypothetical protein
MRRPAGRSIERRCPWLDYRREGLGPSRRAACDRGTKRTEQLPHHLYRAKGGGTTLNWLPSWTPGWLLDWVPSTVSWLPVAELQTDLYSAVKNDPELSRYPVFHVSEGGAETDNVGLQFLTSPAGAGTLLPEGTQLADYANAHNYVCGVRTGYVDNQAWQAADPVLDSHWDRLYGEYGRTWKRHFRGYSNAELQTLPRATTETGWDAASPEEERTQGTVLVNTYLAQFNRGWRYTFIYELGEGEGGGGNQGLFHLDWTPKLATTYIHNLSQKNWWSVLNASTHCALFKRRLFGGRLGIRKAAG